MERIATIKKQDFASLQNDTAYEHSFIGISPLMQAVYEKVERAARADFPVFITGEPGTGKTLCARILHRLSHHANKFFLRIDCRNFSGNASKAVLGEDIMPAADWASLAHGGTLFLDEVAALPLFLQKRFMRLLQRETSSGFGPPLDFKAIKFIAATRADVFKELDAGRISDEFYARLSVFSLHMPPLRRRGEDILDIAQFFLYEFAEKYGKSFSGFTPETEAFFCSHKWPGNVTMLRSVIGQVVRMHDGGIVTKSMLPVSFKSLPRLLPAAGQGLAAAAGFSGFDSPSEIRPLREVEQEIIEKAVKTCGGNIPRAARLLGVSPSTLYRKKSRKE